VKNLLLPLILLLSTASCQIQALPESTDAAEPTSSQAKEASISQAMLGKNLECTVDFKVASDDEKHEFFAASKGLWRNILDGVQGEQTSTKAHVILTQDAVILDDSPESISIAKALIEPASQLSPNAFDVRGVEIVSKSSGIMMSKVLKNGFRIIEVAEGSNCFTFAIKTGDDLAGGNTLFIRGPIKSQRGARLDLSAFLHQTENEIRIFVR
jgi:hypothetical protein